MLGVVVIDYKSPQMTIDYINKELPKVDVPYVCIVVVNEATDKEVSIIADATHGIVVEDGKNARDGKVFIIPSLRNLGFAKGNNLGVEFLKNNFECDYILFSNTDIEIKSGQNLSKMIDCINSNDQIGAVGPMILSRDGSLQLPHYGYVSPYRLIGWFLFPFLRRKRNTVSSISVKEGFCYWVQGSFFIMRTSDFIKVGMFDPNTFLYSEEPILAEKLRRIKKEMYFYPNVSILHYEGGTILAKNTSYRSRCMVVESNCYYFTKYLEYSKLVTSLYKLAFKLNHYLYK